MTTNRKYDYLSICPRGFANEITYFRVSRSDSAAMEEAQDIIDNYATDHLDDGGFAQWTRDKIASYPGVALDWNDL